MLLGVISQCGSASCTLQKRFFASSSPLQFGQEENILGHAIEKRAYWFVLKTARLFPILTSRNRMMNTFVIVNITPHIRDSVEDKSMLAHSKKAFLLPSIWPGIEYTRVLIWKKTLLICFESYQGIPFSHACRVDRNVNTLLMVNINPICKGKIQKINYLLNFILCKEKNLACISSKQVILCTLALNPQLFCQQIHKKTPFDILNC